MAKAAKDEAIAYGKAPEEAEKVAEENRTTTTRTVGQDLTETEIPSERNKNMYIKKRRP